jgi:cytochrome c553
VRWIALEINGVHRQLTRAVLTQVVVLCLITPTTAADEKPAVSLDPAAVEFFEKKIRPLLVKSCYQCHSSKAETIEGGLRLDSRDGWAKGGDSGPAIIPGKPDKSRLLKAVLYQDPDLAMPPENAIPKRDVELIRQWIAMGAPDPRTGLKTDAGPKSIDLQAGQRFWSFQPVSRPLPATVTNEGWVRSPVDRFVLARLESKGLQPTWSASRHELIRRASIDLLGLPPTPDDVDQFVQDTSPDAWERLIDRLLASPQYGERWGRYWLDVARYADDQLRTEYFYRPLPHAWRYRDWVVRAFNEDLPYNEFVIRQIAGDLLHESIGHEGVVAVGLLALGMMYQSDGDTPDGIAVAKAETLDDRVDTVTRGFLGLTVSCARCHDHKFDPIPIEDYYSLAGVFNNTKYVEDAPLAASDVVHRYRQSQKVIAEIVKQLKAAEMAKETAKAERLLVQLNRLKQSAPAIFPRAHSVVDSGSEDMRVATRGNLRTPGAVVPRRFLQVLAGDHPSRFTQGSGRLELARAIASPQNPLTARVMVNRIWQHHFGRGLVATASNFGALGEPPTHPQLLDWLSSRFVESGWSIKRLHREIMLSSTYRLSTRFDASNDAVDSGNRLLWRMNRVRLDVEALRDGLLAVSGQLEQRIGGPSIADLLVSRRRSIYGAVHRDNKTESDEFLRMFDFPNPRMSSSGRTLTTVPQQQLFALNSGFMSRQAKALAARVLREHADTDARIQRTFALVEWDVPHRRLNSDWDACF